MPAGRKSPGLGQRLKELQAKHGETIKVELIADIVDYLSAALQDSVTVKNKRHLAELDALSRYIQSTRSEIAALHPAEVKQTFIPEAADELDAIITATASATNAIMDATEAIDGVFGDVDDKTRQVLGDAITRIYEACGFQDITGQRISKVVKTFQEIETRIDALAMAFGSPDMKKIPPRKAKKGKPAKKGKKKQPISDADLLEGPQMAGTAKTQEEIDALLASFD